MKKAIMIVVLGLLWCNLSLADIYSRFGELTEIRDERMRGKDNQWVRPHPGTFVWNKIEKSQGNFSWVNQINMLFMHRNTIKQY